MKAPKPPIASETEFYGLEEWQAAANKRKKPSSRDARSDVMAKILGIAPSKKPVFRVGGDKISLDFIHHEPDNSPQKRRTRDHRPAKKETGGMIKQLRSAGSLEIRPNSHEEDILCSPFIAPPPKKRAQDNIPKFNNFSDKEQFKSLRRKTNETGDPLVKPNEKYHLLLDKLDTQATQTQHFIDDIEPETQPKERTLPSTQDLELLRNPKQEAEVLIKATQDPSTDLIAYSPFVYKSITSPCILASPSPSPPASCLLDSPEFPFLVVRETQFTQMAIKETPKKKVTNAERKAVVAEHKFSSPIDRERGDYFADDSNSFNLSLEKLLRFSK